MFPGLFGRRTLVLVVCTANVCRSPVAAALLRAELRRLGVARSYRVASAGTHVAAPGRLPDPRMGKLARSVGVTLRGERATPLTPRLAQKAGLIVAMEQSHVDHVQSLLEGGSNPPALRLLGSWHPGDTDAGTDIADPYFANRAALEKVFAQIYASITALALELDGMSRH